MSSPQKKFVTQAAHRARESVENVPKKYAKYIFSALLGHFLALFGVFSYHNYPPDGGQLYIFGHTTALAIMGARGLRPRIQIMHYMHGAQRALCIIIWDRLSVYI